MKVLKNNYNKQNVEIEEPKELICEKCKSELEYEQSDLKIGAYGCAYIDCPVCGYANYIYEENEFELTKDNVEFPTHFSHTSLENAVDCCNNQMVKEYINKAIEYFRKNKDEYHCGGHITGNLYISVCKYEGDRLYDVTVSNDFYSTSIPFEPEDYR